MSQQPSQQAIRGVIHVPDKYAQASRYFGEVRPLAADFNRARFGGRVRPADRTRDARLGKEFAAAHEGPREKIGTPELRLVLTPGGGVTREVHQAVDEAARHRNREKDRQMQEWRNTPLTASRRFNTQSMAPTHLRAKVTPQVFAKHRANRLHRECDHGAGRGD
jgi:hypothetical protein